MALELKYISPNNTEISLTNSSDFILTGADGLTDANIAISATELAQHDGAIINNRRAQPRGIVLYITIKQNADVEQVKRGILSVIKPKQNGRLQWVQRDKTIEIEGVIEAITMPRFTNNVVMQITMYCPQPYWSDAEYILKQIELVIPLHRFKLTIPQGRM